MCKFHGGSIISFAGKVRVSFQEVGPYWLDIETFFKSDPIFFFFSNYTYPFARRRCSSLRIFFDEDARPRPVAKQAKRSPLASSFNRCIVGELA